ncbi:copper resistance protein CopB [Sphingomonas sp. Leaf412]|uniref:copper resistance protein B n=1 Tax=Sphingomonas sp. Leaf412 TaxID=1736370 RepID=UPI0006F31D0F|nr:copper resistance protein B [Sphingomonas sp. Leaf412]KQT35274.1 copper resistance protein CopB [Sphingomonas sp. Leaf412]
MRSLLLAAAALPALASALPAAGQGMEHSRHMPGMTMPAPAATPKTPPRKAAPTPQRRKSVRRTVRPTPKPAAPRASPIAADAADGACMPEHAAMGHCTPAAATTAAPATPAPATAAGAPDDPTCPPEHAAMGHCVPAARTAAPAAAGAGTGGTGTAGIGTGGTALPAGNAPAPAAPDPTYADRIWGRDAMAPARAVLRHEHGGMTLWQVMFNLAEVQFRKGRDGYRWDGEFWSGGDVDRLTVKSEGEGTFGDGAGGEVQVLYSRAVGPYFNLQAGVRQDIAPGPDRTYASVGFEGLAPYWFDVEGAAFLSDRGDVLGRLEGYYDQRITQRLILQPRVELNLSAQDVRSGRLGSGVTDAEAGLRLRYEVVREFAPYVGVSWERRFGGTARYARADGEDTGGFSLVAGVRAWF